MDIRNQLKQTYRDIEVSQRRLDSALDACLYVQAKAYELPAIAEDDSFKAISTLEPSLIEGFTAEAKIRRAWARYYVDSGSSTLCSVKMPGVVQYQAAPGELQRIFELVDDLNKRKRRFEEISQLIDDEYERHAAIHELFPRLHNRQLCRQLHCVGGDLVPDSIGFSFSNKVVAHQVSVDATLTRLEQTLGHSLLAAADAQLARARRDKILDLQQQYGDDLVLVHRRFGKVQPIYNLRYDRQVRQKPASMPLLLLTTTTGPVKLNNLASYSMRVPELTGGEFLDPTSPIYWRAGTD
ncbi:DNA replication terminus site-binding protein [Ferrimonas kyonanensis]|uniref:DNA replication terminus site-binding protein n=1 Tax=Ferrimonas kyonanensis TaxID=364763 RepID=UPI0003FF44F8|nr:DNA replication terminus site-binding protein [Ferrimonas kyonanensis]